MHTTSIIEDLKLDILQRIGEARQKTESMDNFDRALEWACADIGKVCDAIDKDLMVTISTT